MSLQVDIPVNHSVMQEKEKAKRIKKVATSGRKCLKLLNKQDPLGLFAKMLLVTLPWDSTKCYLEWKIKATPQGRLIFQLAVKMHPTLDKESGLLHTPTATANQMTPSMIARDAGSWGNNELTMLMEYIGTRNPIFVEWLMGYPEGWTDLDR